MNLGRFANFITIELLLREKLSLVINSIHLLAVSNNCLKIKLRYRELFHVLQESFIRQE